MVEAKLFLFQKQCEFRGNKRRLSEKTVLRAKDDEDDSSAGWDLDIFELSCVLAKFYKNCRMLSLYFADLKFQLRSKL